MSVLVIGDPHFQLSNLEEVRTFIDKLDTYLSEHEPAHIVVLGDILHDHERLHTTPLNIASEWLISLAERAQTWAIVGNHDLINNSQFLTQNHWMNALKQTDNLNIVDTAVETCMGNRKIVLVPYVPPGRFEEALNQTDWKNADLIFAHQEFKGCHMGSIVSEDGDDWPDTNPPVISGHIHGKQTVGNVFYPGSALPVSFAETGRRIILMIHANGDREEIDLGLKQKKVIYTDADSIADVNPEDHPNRTLKICIDTTKEKFKQVKKSAKFKSLQKAGVKIVFKRSKESIELDNQQIQKHIGHTSKHAGDDASGESTSFDAILHRLVQESNEHVKQAYDVVTK
jgi:predicted phosphodiesterase